MVSMQWVLPGILARSPRPGYATGIERSVPLSAVDAWIQAARASGIASILCLLDGDQLPLYSRALPDGLLAHYRRAGFAVAHIPTPDGKTEPFSAEQLEQALNAFLRLPKPVLVHCSAGYDRTGRVVNHILSRLTDGTQSPT